MSDAFDPYYTWLGIPPEDQPPDHYRLLGLRTFESNPDVIANAADRQMMMVRSFQSGPRSKESQQILNRISTAKVCLLNPQQKSDYDRRLSAVAAARDSSPAAKPAPKPAAPRTSSKSTPSQGVPKIVVASDRRPSIEQHVPARPAWKKPAVIGGAIAVALAVIVISAITLAVSSNPNDPSIAAPDNEAANASDVDTENSSTPDRAVAAADQATSPDDVDPSTTPSKFNTVASPREHANAATPPTDRWLKIRNRQTDRVIGVWQAGKSDGDTLVQWVYVATAPNHHWQLERAAGGGYRILNRGSMKYATAITGSAGTVLEQHGLRDDAIQTWQLKPMGNDVWSIVTPDNSLAIAVKDDETFDGAQLVLEPTGSKGAELWLFDVLEPETHVGDPQGPTTPPVATPAESTVTAIQPAGEPVDLLALIDVDRDVKRGRFIRRDDGLICVAGALHIPYRLPDEYTLTAEVTRVQENDALIVGQVIGGRPCLHMIDGFIDDGTLCGLELVDNQRLPDNPTRRAGQLLTADKPATIVYTVRQNRLTVTVDGKMVTQWDGEPNRLRWYSFFKEPKDRNVYIGSWGSVYRFSKLELVPLGGEVIITAVAGTPPEETSEPVKRLAVPDSEKQKTVLGQVKEIYKDEYQAATTPEGRSALAEKLIEQSGEAGLEAAAQFVLLREVLKYAAESVQPDPAFQAADRLGRQFEIDPLTLKIEAVSDMEKAAWDADSRKRVAAAAMAVSRQCLLGGRAPEAEKLSELAEDAATRSRDGELRIKARTWHADVRQFVQQWNVAEEAKEVLATKPDDGEANTQLGKFLCLTMDDWEKGLPHLVKTDRANLRQLAEMELAAPQAATDKVELADAWWEAAKSAVSDEKDAYQRRARHWYQAALTDLAGLQKIKVERRLETLADVGESFLLARNKPDRRVNHDPPRRVNRVADPPRLKADGPITAQLIPARKLGGHSVFVYEAMFSDDGTVIFTKAHSNAPGAERTVKIWNAATGELIRVFEQDQNGFGPIVPTSMFRDGKSLVAVKKSTPDQYWGDRLVFWDTRTGQRKKELVIAERDLTVAGAPRFTPSGDWLALGSEHGLAFYDTSNWQRKKVVNCFGSQVYSWVLNDNLIAVSKFGKPTIECWGIESGEIEFEIPVNQEHNALSISPDQKLLAGAPGTHEIWLHDVENLRPQRVLRAQMGSVRSTAFSPWGRLLASGDAYKKLILWDCTSGQLLCEFKCEGQVSVTAFSPDGRQLLSAQTDGQVLLWNVVVRQGR